VRRFVADDSVTFCVGGGSAGELDWPPLSNPAGEYFPVTFTNGKLGGGGITGEITIHAQTDADQCQPPTPDNRACKLLSKARVGSLLGPGSFPFHSQSRDDDHAVWICFYNGSGGEVNFNLARSFNRSPREVRRGVRRQIEELGLERLDAGDLAGIGTFTDDEGKTFSLVVMAVGRENALFIIGPGAQRQNARTLARRVAGEID
jgi:hypothetical protein